MAFDATEPLCATSSFRSEDVGFPQRKDENVTAKTWAHVFTFLRYEMQCSPSAPATISALASPAEHVHRS
jgi:hypothetical protein